MTTSPAVVQDQFLQVLSRDEAIARFRAALALHPGVLEAGVTGTKDERTGEAVVAFVVRKDPDLTEEQVIAHCRTSLAAYKVPKQVVFRTELPKSPIGKILRRKLFDHA